MVEFTGIDLRNNVVCLNNPGNFLQLRPIRPHKQEPIRLSLPFGFPVVFCACQREQEPEQASEKFSMPSEIAIALCPVFYYNVTWKNEKATSFLSNLIVLCPGP